MGKIIAVVGMCGAGKSEVSNFFQQKGYQFLRFGQITLDEVKQRGLTPTEENEREIRERLRKEHGMAAFAILNMPKIKELSERGNLVIDGLYSWQEYKVLKETFPELQLLAVHTPPETRYSRLEKRVVDEKMRNRPMTREQAKSRDYSEIENIEKAGPIAMADIVITNYGTPLDLIEQLKRVFGEYEGRPGWDEYFLKMAALVAERSTCHRHHVGSVITRGKRVLTTGYNGAAKNEPDCLELGCLKDAKGIPSGEGSEECRAIHAEQNAIIQAALFGISIEGTTMYCTHTPCRMCAKEIKQAGIKEFVSYQAYVGDKGAKKALEGKIILRTIPRPRSKIIFKD